MITRNEWLAAKALAFVLFAFLVGQIIGTPDDIEAEAATHASVEALAFAIAGMAVKP